MSAAPRNAWVDLLRAGGALAVVLFHFNVLPVDHPATVVSTAWHDFWNYGHLGVGVFFFLSGYCLMPGWNRSAGAADFLRRRFGRIMPPYWCSLLLIVLLAVAFRLAGGVNDVAPLPRTVPAVLATGLLLTAPVTAIPTMNWVYWTLSCIAAFYLLAGGTLLAPRPARPAVLAGLHVALCLVDAVWHPAAAGALFFCKFWPVFGLGAALGLLPLARRPALVMLVASAAHALAAFLGGTDNTHYIAVACVMALLCPLLGTLPFPPWLAFLAAVGPFSYSLYLIHVPVGIHGFMRPLPTQFHSDLAFIGSQLLLLAVILPVAWLFYRVAERPFLPRASAA